MLKTYDCHNEVQNGSKSIESREDEMDEVSDSSKAPPIPKRSKNSKLSTPSDQTNSSLKNNTIIGALNGNLIQFPNLCSLDQKTFQFD